MCDSYPLLCESRLHRQCRGAEVWSAISYCVLMAVFWEEGKMRESENFWEEMREKYLEHDAALLWL